MLMQACTDLKSLKEISEPCNNGVIMAQGPTKLSYVLNASGNADTDFTLLH